MPANESDFRLNGHTIAGIVDAEAHFAITENNGGGSMSCWMAIALRDDDIGLLHALASETRLGVVRRTDDRGNPQAAWIVYRKDEVAALASLLKCHPLRSRKRQDFDVWTAAVELWCGSAENRVERMRELRHSIRDARRYVATAACKSAVERETAGFDDWLAGFIAGDGYLGIAGGDVRLTLKLRADEAPVLAWIRECTGMGNICGPYPNRAAHPSLAWNVTRAADLLALADRLDRRVPGRKGREFAVWRRAVVAHADRSSPARQRRQLIDRAEQELVALRRYRPGPPPPAAKTRRLQRMYEQNGVWIALLREWAEEEPGPLSAETYQRARRAGWPSRNTLAARFGSWYDALDAAGLASRAALAPEARDARLRGGELRRAERRQEQRERVIAALRRCAAAFERFPGPTEYARWRLHNDPGAPSFGTAYRLFPGGWDELQAACAAGQQGHRVNGVRA
jgi:hypothetical protein